MRPHTEADREARRDFLADQVLQAFAEMGYAKLTIGAVAKQAGMGKGTIFLAFATKEELVLHAVGRSFKAWVGRLKPLGAIRRTPGDFAFEILGTLRADPALLPLLALIGPVLEQSCTLESLLRFKQAMAKELESLIEAWAPKWPTVPRQAWWPLFMRVYAAILGAWAVSDSPDIFREALARNPGLSVFIYTFDDLVLPMLEAQLAAVL